MKRLVLFFATLLVLVSASGLAQVSPPQGINYQAVARDNSGAVLANQSIDIRVSILSQLSPQVTAYQEVHDTLTTNAFGLFTLVIGQGQNTGVFITPCRLFHGGHQNIL